MTQQIGQLSNEEFLAMYERTGKFSRGYDVLEKTAWLNYGKYTTNYYFQHEDGSWTNYKCVSR